MKSRFYTISVSVSALILTSTLGACNTGSGTNISNDNQNQVLSKNN